MRKNVLAAVLLLGICMLPASIQARVWWKRLVVPEIPVRQAAAGIWAGRPALFVRSRNRIWRWSDHPVPVLKGRLSPAGNLAELYYSPQLIEQIVASGTAEGVAWASADKIGLITAAGRWQRKLDFGRGSVVQMAIVANQTLLLRFADADYRVTQKSLVPLPRGGQILPFGWPQGEVWEQRCRRLGSACREFGSNEIWASYTVLWQNGNWIRWSDDKALVPLQIWRKSDRESRGWYLPGLPKSITANVEDGYLHFVGLSGYASETRQKLQAQGLQAVVAVTTAEQVLVGHVTEEPDAEACSDGGQIRLLAQRLRRYLGLNTSGIRRLRRRAWLPVMQWSGVVAGDSDQGLSIDPVYGVSTTQNRILLGPDIQRKDFGSGRSWRVGLSLNWDLERLIYDEHETSLRRQNLGELRDMYEWLLTAAGDCRANPARILGLLLGGKY